MTKPFVSVLIDTYNHERFIAEAVNSVLAQDFPASQREVLVVDDGSTDSTPEILRKYEPQIRFLRKANGGQASAFNFGSAQCTGEIVSFLDGDDWWAPDKLTRVVGAMTADPAIGIVGHGIINVNRDGSEMVETLREGFRFQANSMDGARLLRRRGAFLGTSRMTIRASLLRQIGPVPEGIEIQADEYLFTLASVLAVAQILPDALTFYRLHDANLFQLSGRDPEKLRHKQKALTVLTNSLLQRLAALGIAPDVCRTVTEYTQASADQLRLQLDGGWPWETVAAEWHAYSTVHTDASFSHRLFKLTTLLGALVMPPRVFYKVQRALAQNSFYRRARQRVLPVPEMRHLERDKRPKP